MKNNTIFISTIDINNSRVQTFASHDEDTVKGETVGFLSDWSDETASLSEEEVDAIMEGSAFILSENNGINSFIRVTIEEVVISKGGVQ